MQQLFGNSKITVWPALVSSNPEAAHQKHSWSQKQSRLAEVQT